MRRVVTVRCTQCLRIMNAARSLMTVVHAANDEALWPPITYCCCATDLVVVMAVFVAVTNLTRSSRRFHLSHKEVRRASRPTQKVPRTIERCYIVISSVSANEGGLSTPVVAGIALASRRASCDDV